MKTFDPWPVFFRREWNRNWPFLTGFAITGYLICKMTANFTEEDLKNSNAAGKEPFTDHRVLNNNLLVTTPVIELISFILDTMAINDRLMISMYVYCGFEVLSLAAYPRVDVTFSNMIKHIFYSSIVVAVLGFKQERRELGQRSPGPYTSVSSFVQAEQDTGPLAPVGPTGTAVIRLSHRAAQKHLGPAARQHQPAPAAPGFKAQNSSAAATRGSKQAAAGEAPEKNRRLRSAVERVIGAALRP
ncbi:hypothetical protein PR202_ga19749 [Eleusine coracana subsp. coracana]|uniref:Uncharacterized protein n=1 Tax=Eleusine coracana subsp. coracana TaxID=191504 RepID=A0AAV5CWD6_ELECO|nr:hypothetical protein PR202_ga19749 [Eleusine coracana subsp. coracana]